MIIKYKCWDKDNKVWLIPDLEHLHSMFTPEGHALRIVAPDEYELVLWTGFQDKNGTDIYPGDILDDRYFVWWDVLKGAWGMFDDRKGAGGYGGFNMHHPYTVEITGNIFEDEDWVKRKSEKRTNKS